MRRDNQKRVSGKSTKAVFEERIQKFVFPCEGLLYEETFSSLDYSQPLITHFIVKPLIQKREFSYPLKFK